MPLREDTVSSDIDSIYSATMFGHNGEYSEVIIGLLLPHKKFLLKLTMKKVDTGQMQAAEMRI